MDNVDELKRKQAKEYLKEAENSLKTAEIVFENCKNMKEDLWANVVKSCYDAMEQAVSSALGFSGKEMPREHPRKIDAFISEFCLDDSDIFDILRKWLSKRSNAQYVDIKFGRIIVPHEIFDKWDAEEAIKDAKTIIKFVKKLESE